MQRVTIMRGIPGAGKSTWLSVNRPNAIVCSADHFHLKDGKYDFKQENAKAAHDGCLRKFVEIIAEGSTQDLAVDNTCVKVFEIAPYYRIAEALDFAVEIIWIHCLPDVGWCRTIHHVPPAIVSAMANSFEPLPPWWKITHIRS